MKIKTEDWQDILAYGMIDPVWFIEEILGEKLWQKQKDIINSLWKYPRTAVRSAHGTGKTTVGSMIVILFLILHPDSIVISTGASYSQLINTLWRKINAAYSRYKSKGIPLEGNLTEGKLEMGEEWFAIARNPIAPDKIMGYHSDNILFLVDEGSGLNETVFKRRGAILTGPNPKELLMGNPYYPYGSFYTAFSTDVPEKGGYNKIHISMFDSPNVKGDTIPEWAGLPTQQDIDKVISDFGKDSNEYRIRVLGEFPKQSAVNVFDIEKIDEMFVRPYREMRFMPRVLSIDPARFGDDSTAFVEFEGPNVIAVTQYKKKDASYIIGEATRLHNDRHYHEIVVDTAGLGGPIYDIMSKTLPCYSFNSGAKSENDSYYNIITEAWFEAAKALKSDEITFQVPEHSDRLRSDLMNRIYKYNGTKLILESKDDVKKRSLPSPDVGDAFTMGWDSVVRQTRKLLRKQRVQHRHKPTGGYGSGG